MTAAAQNMGLDPSTGWDGEIPEANKPLYSIPEMIQKTKKRISHLMQKTPSAKRVFPVCCRPGSTQTRLCGTYTTGSGPGHRQSIDRLPCCSGGKDGSLSSEMGVISQIGFVKWACVYCPVLHKTPLGISKGESVFRA